MGKKREERPTPGSPKVSPAPEAKRRPPAAPTKRKAAPKSPLPPGFDPISEAKSDIPEEMLEGVDAKILAEFRLLKARHQKFIVHFIKTDNATEAYRLAYDMLKGDASAETGAYQLRRNTKIKAVLAAFQSHRDDDIIRIRQAYLDGLGALKPIFSKDSAGQAEHVEDLPDHQTRIKAAEMLAKLHGANAADKVEHSGEVLSKIVQVSLPTKKPVA